MDSGAIIIIVILILVFILTIACTYASYKAGKAIIKIIWKGLFDTDSNKYK